MFDATRTRARLPRSPSELAVQTALSAYDCRRADDLPAVDPPLAAAIDRFIAGPPAAALQAGKRFLTRLSQMPAGQAVSVQAVSARALTRLAQKAPLYSLARQVTEPADVRQARAVMRRGFDDYMAAGESGAAPSFAPRRPVALREAEHALEKVDVDSLLAIFLAQTLNDDQLQAWLQVKQDPWLNQCKNRAKSLLERQRCSSASEFDQQVGQAVRKYFADAGIDEEEGLHDLRRLARHAPPDLPPLAADEAELADWIFALVDFDALVAQLLRSEGALRGLSPELGATLVPAIIGGLRARLGPFLAQIGREVNLHPIKALAESQEEKIRQSLAAEQARAFAAQLRAFGADFGRPRPAKTTVARLKRAVPAVPRLDLSLLGAPAERRTRPGGTAAAAVAQAVAAHRDPCDDGGAGSAQAVDAVIDRFVTGEHQVALARGMRFLTRLHQDCHAPSLAVPLISASLTRRLCQSVPAFAQARAALLPEPDEHEPPYKQDHRETLEDLGPYFAGTLPERRAMEGGKEAEERRVAEAQVMIGAVDLPTLFALVTVQAFGSEPARDDPHLFAHAGRAELHARVMPLIEDKAFQAALNQIFMAAAETAEAAGQVDLPLHLLLQRMNLQTPVTYPSLTAEQYALAQKVYAATGLNTRLPEIVAGVLEQASLSAAATEELTERVLSDCLRLLAPQLIAASKGLDLAAIAALPQGPDDAETRARTAQQHADAERQLQRFWAALLRAWRRSLRCTAPAGRDAPPQLAGEAWEPFYTEEFSPETWQPSLKEENPPATYELSRAEESLPGAVPAPKAPRLKNSSRRLTGCLRQFMRQTAKAR